MKYIKNFHGLNIIREKYEITVYENKQLINNPSEELLEKHGWRVYAKDEKELLEVHKKEVIKNINNYDISPDVNGFTINGVKMWLDKATRASLMLRLQAEQTLGKTDTCIWYNGMSFTVTVDQAIYMLYQLEDYAAKCYDNTKKHMATVQQLTTIEEVENYDYRTGYPEQPVFNTSLVG